jgi:C_GCAxxG_C_C family probable redox protein
MITRGDLKLNCAESTLLKVNEVFPLRGFDSDIMRVASAFGGGVGGWGSACGALSGAVMALGLVHGTEGSEETTSFKDMRDALRDMAQELLSSFEKEFGCVNCMDLLEIDRRTEEGKKLFDQLKEEGKLHCDEYVQWATDKTLKILTEEKSEF